MEKKHYECKIIKLGRDNNTRLVSEVDLLAAADGLQMLASVANNLQDPQACHIAQARVRTMASVFKFVEDLLNAKVLNGGQIAGGVFYGTLEPNQAFLEAFYPGLEIENVKAEKDLTNGVTLN